ncbi:unnamed protein product, partial [Callosobruchus maculatus]
PYNRLRNFITNLIKHEDENRSLGGFVKGVKKVWPLVKIVGPKVAKGAWKLIKNSAGKSSGGLKNTTSELERTLPDDVVEQLLRKTAKHEDENRSLGGFVKGVKKVWPLVKIVGPTVVKGAWKLIKKSAGKSSGGLKNTTSELERTLPDDVVEQLLRKTAKHEDEDRSLGGFVKKVWSVAKNVGPKVAKGAWKLIKNSAFRSSGGLKDTTYELERILPDDVVEQLLRKTAKHEDEDRSLGGFVKGLKKIWPFVKKVGPKVAKGAWKLIKNSAGKSSGGLKNTTSELERTLPDDVVEQLLRKTAKHEDEDRSLGGFVKKVWSVAKNVGPKVAKGAWKLIKNSAFRSSGGLEDTTYELERILPDDVVEQLLRKTDTQQEDESRSLQEVED